MVTLILVLGWLSLSNQVITFTFFVSEIALYALDVYYNQTYLNQQSKYIKLKSEFIVNQRQKELNFTISWLLPGISRNEEGALLSLKWFKMRQMVSVMIWFSSLSQWEASACVTWSVLTNQKPVFWSDRGRPCDNRRDNDGQVEGEHLTLNTDHW